MPNQEEQEQQLKAAIQKIHEALEIARNFQEQTGLSPSLNDLKLFEQLSWNFWMAFNSVEKSKAALENNFYGGRNVVENKTPNKFQWVYRSGE